MSETRLRSYVAHWSQEQDAKRDALHAELGAEISRIWAVLGDALNAMRAVSDRQQTLAADIKQLRLAIEMVAQRAQQYADQQAARDSQDDQDEAEGHKPEGAAITHEAGQAATPSDEGGEDQVADKTRQEGVGT
jgi:hypothetical protein